MTYVLSALQVFGVLAVLVGVALTLPLGPALLVGGVLLVAAATAAEASVRGARSAPSDRRSTPRAPGVL